MQPPLANLFQPLINVFDAILKVLSRRRRVGMGSRDHRADGADPLAAAAADAQAAALDVPDGPVHATDQEAARQARLGPAAPAAGDAGVLQGEQDQPARVGPAGAGAAAGLPLF